MISWTGRRRQRSMAGTSRSRMLGSICTLGAPGSRQNSHRTSGAQPPPLAPRSCCAAAVGSRPPP
eukprot:7386540-Prymnesium_polylepis.1